MFSRRRWMDWGLARSPRSTTAGSPGMSLRKRKTTMETPRRTGMDSRRRLVMKANIGSYVLLPGDCVPRTPCRRGPSTFGVLGPGRLLVEPDGVVVLGGGGV